jgi:ATP-dependent RNA helicase DHX33
MLSIIAMLSDESPFNTPLDKRQQAAVEHQKFSCNEGDPLVLLKVYRGFRQAKTVPAKRDFCLRNFLNIRVMDRAEKARKQLQEVCERCEIPIKSLPQSTTTPIRKALCEGM